MSQAFGGPKGSGAKAPEKGVFPLDHFAECKKVRFLNVYFLILASSSRCQLGLPGR